MPHSFSFLLFFIGLSLGGLVGWFLQAARSRGELIFAQAEIQNARAEALRNKEAQLQAAEMMKAEFRNLATEILEEKSQRLTEKSKEQLGGVLTPLKENLETFRKRVEEIHTSQVENSGRDRKSVV